ncbi:unnamed protein product [Gadus morhua 'NCC']
MKHQSFTMKHQPKSSTMKHQLVLHYETPAMKVLNLESPAKVLHHETPAKRIYLETPAEVLHHETPAKRIYLETPASPDHETPAKVFTMKHQPKSSTIKHQPKTSTFNSSVWKEHRLDGFSIRQTLLSVMEPCTAGGPGNGLETVLETGLETGLEKGLRWAWRRAWRQAWRWAGASRPKPAAPWRPLEAPGSHWSHSRLEPGDPWIQSPLEGQHATGLGRRGHGILPQGFTPN